MGVSVVVTKMMMDDDETRSGRVSTGYAEGARAGGSPVTLLSKSCYFSRIWNGSRDPRSDSRVVPQK